MAWLGHSPREYGVAEDENGPWTITVDPGTKRPV